MSHALLFPGQGSQHAEMLRWLDAEPHAAAALRGMCRRLGDDWRERMPTPAWLDSNAVAQVLVTGVCLAAWAALSARLSAPPAVVAGYSVGELAAYAAAGVFDVEQALALAVRRAAAMDAAGAGTPTGLLSVSGMDEAAVLMRCADLALETAIRIDVAHVIVAGTLAALDEAERRLPPQGASCRRLGVALASHSSWMRPAAAAFSRALEPLSFLPVRCPIAVNAGGAATRDAAALKRALSRQIDHPVSWDACMDTVAERRVDRVLELGPGTALARMWRVRHPRIPVRSLEDFRDAAGAAAWLKRDTG
jgi:[acyl-carrier-protein] S-malonyltransferase